MAEATYKIVVDARTTYTVFEHQLYKDRWIEYFGGVEGVKNFIKNYKK